MKSVPCSFQDFDPVVVALTDTVGFVVFPGVLYVSAPVTDHVSNMAHFGNFGGTVDIESFGQLGTLEYRHGHIIYAVEALESLIGFIQIRIGMQEFCNPFFNNRSFQIIFGVDAGLLGNKHAHALFSFISAIINLCGKEVFMAMEYTEEHLNNIDRATLVQLFLVQQSQLQDIDRKLQLLLEQVAVLNDNRFGRSSEYNG